MELPDCPHCKTTKLLPLSDYASDGASVIFKAWACPNEACSFVLRIDKGTCSYDRVTPAVPNPDKTRRALSNHPDPGTPRGSRR
jgi:hypothetical protein